jgi:RES domain-containing protein
LFDLPAGTTLFRAHSPRWADRPTSGVGAARQGGRFNRPGTEALYLSLEATTAMAEYQQTSPFLPPCTLCSYAVALRALVDLRQWRDGAPWHDLWRDWRCNWRAMLFDDHIEPPTWDLADMARAAGHTGIVFPSETSAGGTNVVVYTDRLAGGNTVEVIDPGGLLPRDQSSWGA